MKRLLVLVALLLSLAGCMAVDPAPEIRAIRAYDAHGLFTVKFVAYSDAASFEWHIDGVIYYGNNIIHAYDTPGNYTARLVVSNTRGASTSETFQFTVYYNSVCYWNEEGRPQFPGGCWEYTYGDDRPSNMRIMGNE